MHRTQLLFEERQYRELSARARREHKSMSELVRQAVDGFMGTVKPGTKKRRIGELRGLFSDTASGLDHDSILYGESK